MRSLIRGIIVIIVTIYMGLIYGSTAIISLGFAEVLFVVLSFASLLHIRKNTDPKLIIPLALAEQNQTLRVIVENESKEKLKPGRIRYLVTVRNPITEKKHKKWLPTDADYFFTVEDPGGYEFELKEVKIYDWSGLFYVRKKLKEKKHVQVNPKIFSVPIRVTERLKNFFGEADVYDDFRPGYDPAELFAVRDFQNGDKLQRIHWKLSAKMDNLMVKEHSLPKACAVTLLANPRRKKKESLKAELKWSNHTMSHHERIAFIQTIVGLSFSMMDQGCPHYVAWYSEEKKDIVRARVDDEEGFYLFLVYFLEEPINMRIDSRKLYKERFASERLLHLIEIQSDLTVVMDKTYQNKLNIKYLNKEMEKMELEL